MAGGAFIISSLISSLIFTACFNPGSGKEDWEYVEVRGGAHMFWWLYYANSSSVTDLPLILWLQGGPGASGCGYGNFEEIGPLNTDLQPRDTTWVSAASVLFVDNPVGTGYSYTDSTEALTKNVEMVSADMMVLLQSFFNKRTEFQNTPFYIFSESYGGKMASVIALDLTKAIKKGSIRCRFEGVALGDSWISPIDSVMTWAPYLYSTSLLDEAGFKEVMHAAKEVKAAVDAGEYENATQLWSHTENVIEQNTNGVNFYNILTQQNDDDVLKLRGSRTQRNYLSALTDRHVRPLYRRSLADLMNGPIREKLAIIPKNITWGGQASDVFYSMAGDFMKPVVEVVDALLAEGVNVIVYNGQLDLIVDTMGQESWVKRLKWAGLAQFEQMKWVALEDPQSEGQTGAFQKCYQNFCFYWILKAGHMIPSDQGPMALRMMKMITKQE